jgi:uncharacterized protein DUF1552
MNGKKSSKVMDYSARGPLSPARRRFLRGFGGVIVGLPFLEALAPRSAAAQDAGVIKRFAAFFCCNGVNMDRWFPTGAYGALTDAHLTGTANEALLPFRQKMLFPRGVHMSPRGFGRDKGTGAGGDDHGKGMAHKLTAQFADSQNWLALGPSLDHVIAAQINPGSAGSRRPPLNLMVGRPAGFKGLDYVSYSASGRAVAAINNPWTAYSSFMNLSNATPDSGAAVDKVQRRRQSVLDLVRDEFDSLKRGPLSVADREKLDAHFTAIRDLEGQIAGGLVSCGDSALTTRAQGYDGAGDRVEEQAEYPNIADIQIDVMALAIACDFTRVATMQFDRGSGGPIFRWDGMQHEYSHHKLSHGKVKDDCFGDSTENGCSNVAGYEDMLFAIDRWHIGKLARLLGKLDSYVEANGKTVLDNSAILYTNELSNGKAHSFMDLPYILIGSAGGYLKQNQYVLLGEDGNSNDDQRAPHNKLLNTLVNSMGIQSNWFGAAEGTGGVTMQAGVYEDLLA